MEITRFTVEDEDILQNHIYTLAEDDNGMFSITEDGTLLKATPDVLDPSAIHCVTVMASDSGNEPLKVAMMNPYECNIVKRLKNIRKYVS